VVNVAAGARPVGGWGNPLGGSPAGQIDSYLQPARHLSLWASACHVAWVPDGWREALLGRQADHSIRQLACTVHRMKCPVTRELK
jgi:hypothetical protein